MATAATKQVRISARASQEVMDTLRHAADLTGATVNQFFIQAALKEAQAVIDREQTIRLSKEESEWLLGLIENPPPKNAALKAAMKRYKKAKIKGEDSSFNWPPRQK